MKPQKLGLYLFDFKIINPIRAAKNDANKTLILEATITSGSLNAKLVIKMLIVNPMPPKSDIPIM